ncbi:MAG: hypothetical protein HYY43_04125 [Deltaproteobacteria bacterium]|nr:hypothetical protein [Deltaproteobacteria bacterium]MBI2974756.1 hypothetical protein [Deltaproteobacteria bacterium]
MPTIGDFTANFGWVEAFVVFIITFAIVGIREWHYFRKKDADEKANLQSTE